MDYIIHHSDVDQKDYLIALKHNSLGRKPVREVHGGCTPEEVLVPFLVITNKKDISRKDYSISILTPEISKRDLIASFEIIPKPKVATFKVLGKAKRLEYDDQSKKWNAKLEKSLGGRISIEIQVEETIETYTINIISGLIEEDLF